MKWRRFKGRFGISAPKLAIRPHVPWYWRASATAVILAVALALAHWIYDAGRSLAGFQWRESEQELAELKTEVVRLRAENEKFLQQVNASESSVQIEQTAQAKLTEQVRHLVAENGQLKEELAVFESLATGSAKTAAATLSRLTVEPDAGVGQYRYRVLLAAGSNAGDREITGVVQLAVNAVQGDKPVMLTLPKPGDKEVRVNFRRFLRHTGNFVVPADVRIKEVEARLIVGGSVIASSKVSL